MRKIFTKQEIAILRRGGIGDEMQKFLFTSVSSWSITSSIEVGVAGGSGSAAIIDAGSKDHHGIDLSEKFYYNNDFFTGDLVLGDPCFQLHVGSLIDVLKRETLPTFNFVYIDADHCHPAPSVDLLNLLIADKLDFPFRLVLDDVGLSLKYRRENFKWRGPAVLCSSLSNKFKPTYSPSLSKSEMNGFSVPNQVYFDIHSRDALIMSLQEVMAIQPYEKPLDSFVLL